MENEELIREQMNETRAAMSEKLELLEQKVVDTVDGTATAVTDAVEAVKDTVKETTSAVAETVCQVKESVSETVHTVTDTVKGGLTSVKDFFDIRKNPWLGIGGSVVAGYVVAKFVFPPRRDPIQGLSSAGGYTVTSTPPSAAAAVPAPSQRSHAMSTNGGSHRDKSKSADSKGWLASLAGQWEPEINKVKGMALGMLIDVSRDVVVKAMPPQWKEQLMGVFQGLASKLHATPESLEGDEECESSQASTHDRGDREDGSRMERSGQRHGNRDQFDR